MWNTMKLKDVLSTTITGEWGTECTEYSDSTKVLRTTNFTNSGKLKLDSIAVRQIAQIKIDKKQLEYGDIILEKSGGSDNQPVGRVVYFDIKNDVYLCNNFTQILRPNKDIICSRYLFYFLMLMHIQKVTELMQNKTTGIRNLDTKSYMNIEIPVPSIHNQEKIANALDNIVDIIDKRREQILLMDKLAKDMFILMFGDPVTNLMKWNTKKIQDFAVVKTGGTPSRKESSYWNGDIPWVKTGEIQRNTILCAAEYITDVAVKCSNAKLVPKNSILIAMYGQGKTRGMTAILGLDATINQACAAILPNETYCTEYLFNYIMNSYERLRELARGGNQPNLNLNLVKTFEVLLPPVDLQNQFAERIVIINNQKEILKTSFTELETTYKSTMQKAFNGELFN